ncbi:uncharacterized protein I303_102084 [Kwoniella dejecticola CBS 10117]|uniref:Stealth protein CR3 conserved region 3 domain-containing protein n=1 Tax=Kwoniella dejecticola CBS 10117 TaxID=1296121 RepID=A0A1A6ABX8_9TREE|nr:uncharacterized protein I303_01775 [Kwoniella dejecticola CBS 10117]OBR87567.1 hypothetical protein I303_01775 [Kwoniella dejecticola CBS 10117]
MIVRPRRIRTKVLGYLFSSSTLTSTSTSIEITPKSPLYTAIPSSPTSSVSSLDSISAGSAASEMSDGDHESFDMTRRESFPDSIASSSTVASCSRLYPEKHYQEQEDDEEYENGFEFDTSESSGLLGFLPKWKKVEGTLPLSHNRRQRRKLRKSNWSLASIFGVLCCGVVVSGGLYCVVQHVKDKSIYVAVAEIGSTYPNQAESMIETPQWVSNVQEIPNDPTHVLIPPHDPPKVELLQPIHDRLPYEVLESYFSTGLIPSTFDSDSPHAKQAPLDLVYLFVNASSPFLQENKASAEQKEGIEVVGGKRHWRDNGELRGAVRSGIKHMNEHIGKVHVISADWELTQQDIAKLGYGDDDLLEKMNGWRIGQIPEWLDWESQKETDQQSKLRWHFHNDIFQLPVKSNGQIIAKPSPQLENDHDQPEVESTEAEGEEEHEDLASDPSSSTAHGTSEDGSEYYGKSDEEFEYPRVDPPVPVNVYWDTEEEWKQLATPSFNSFAIESRMSWLHGVSENFIAFNDDMFLLRDLSQSDFRHPLLGNVLRMDSGLLVAPEMNPMQLTDSGEWGALQHANELISRRFPARRRMYLHHLPKTQSKTILNEALTMFGEELSEAATRTFRESKRGKGDAEMAWLTTNLRIERWREALLWSWIVAKIGHKNGGWNNDARSDFINTLGITDEHISGNQKLLIQRRDDRKTLSDSFHADSQVGWQGPKATTYQFSSLDGHLNLLSDEPNKRCLFSLDQCLPADFFVDAEVSYTSEEIFKQIAFAEPACGDCLIHALINESGKNGIEAFLPTSEQIYLPPKKHAEQQREREWITSEPVLPLTDSWEGSDFSIETNVFEGQDTWSGALRRKDGGVELRRWVIKLLSRYTYVFGSTPSMFSPIHNYGQLDYALGTVARSPDLAMFCVNDDQYDASNGEVKRLFGTWMKDYFGGEIEGVNYERPNVEWEELVPEDEDISEQGGEKESPSVREYGIPTISLDPAEAAQGGENLQTWSRLRERVVRRTSMLNDEE